MMVIEFIKFLCVLFTVWFLIVVGGDAVRELRYDTSQGKKYEKNFLLVVFDYVCKSFWYHFPKL